MQFIRFDFACRSVAVLLVYCLFLGMSSMCVFSPVNCLSFIRYVYTHFYRYVASVLVHKNSSMIAFLWLICQQTTKHTHWMNFYAISEIEIQICQNDQRARVHTKHNPASINSTNKFLHRFNLKITHCDSTFIYSRIKS